MEVSDLRTFLAVMDSGSISQAAKALHRVPSGITARIMQMEERPSERQVREIGEAWRPHRGAVAIFAWHHYATPVI